MLSVATVSLLLARQPPFVLPHPLSDLGCEEGLARLVGGEQRSKQC